MEEKTKLSEKEFLLFIAEILFKLINLLAEEAYQRRGFYAGHTYENLSLSIREKISCFKK